jgi:hypothetical protein
MLKNRIQKKYQKGHFEQVPICKSWNMYVFCQRGTYVGTYVVSTGQTLICLYNLRHF